jgi:hypothetical protein
VCNGQPPAHRSARLFRLPTIHRFTCVGRLDEWKILSPVEVTLSMLALQIYLAFGAAASGADRSAVLAAISDVDGHIKEDLQYHVYRRAGCTPTHIEGMLMVAEELEEDVLTTRYANHILDTYPFKGGARACAYRALARIAIRGGRRSDAVASFKAAAAAAMESFAYSLAWLIGRECGGTDGQKIIHDACAAMGKTDDVLEREYVDVLSLVCGVWTQRSEETALVWVHVAACMSTWAEVGQRVPLERRSGCTAVISSRITAVHCTRCGLRGCDSAWA